MNAPLVSVVMPVLNGQKYLRQSLDSVLTQTYHPIEIVVVNDGSTDETAAILASYGDRVTVIEQDHQGVAIARNAAMRNAAGKYLAFLDHDDWWRPEKIEKQVAQFEANPRVGLVHTGVDHFDDATGAWVGPLNPLSRPERLSGECYEELLLDNAIYNSSAMIRAAVLEKSGLCDISITGNTIQDYDLWLRIARWSELAYVPEPLLAYRLHGGQGLWHRPRMLAAEARLLERILAESDLQNRCAMRRRMAVLYESLGTAHFDAGDHAEARRAYWRSLRWWLTSRSAVRLAAVMLPSGVLRAIESVRRNMKQ